MNIYFLTFATDRNKCYILEKSCKCNGIPLRIIGLNDKWEGFGTKYILIKKYLEENTDINDDDFIIFNDGYDTICQDSFDQIYQKIKNYPQLNEKIVVSCELYLWPPSIFSLKNYFDQMVTESNYKYPCSGQYGGTKKNLIDFYKNMNVTHNQDDQEALILYCVNNPKRILYDNFCLFFQPNVFKLKDETPHYFENTGKKKEFDPFLNEDLRLVLKDNKIFIENIRTQTKPSFIHANGPPKEFLKQFFIKYVKPIKDGLKFQKILPPCFAITMPDRKNYISSILTTHNIPYQEFQAIKGKDYNYNDLYTKKIISHPNLGLTLGEIGCYLSHANVYKQFDNDPNLNKILIFEDDIRIPNYLTCKCLKEYIFEALQKVPKDCDILYLGRCYDNCGASEPVNDLIIKVFNPLCLHAYIIFRKAYEKFKDIFPIKDAIDRYIVNKIQFEGLKAYATNPPLIMQNNKLKSNVQRAETNYTPVCGDYHDPSHFYSDFIKNSLLNNDLEIKDDELTLEIINDDKTVKSVIDITQKLEEEKTLKKIDNTLKSFIKRNWILVTMLCIFLFLIGTMMWMKRKNLTLKKYNFGKRIYNF